MLNNCYFWCAWKLVAHGGRIKFYKSKRWIGWHTTWVDKNGVEWEYTMPKMKHKPWWYVPILYKGIIRRVSILEYRRQA